MLLAARRCAALRPVARRLTVPKAATTEAPEVVADEDKYRGTVLLPDTSFPQRAGAVKTEPKIQKFWTDTNIYEKLWEKAPNAAFTLHDGPPYANGDLHIGHALNKILKDFINRSRMLRGDKVRYVPGWDCHGLPIELKVLQQINDKNKKIKKKTGEMPPPLTPLQLRERAAQFAQETVENQRESFKRYGVWADWDAPYLTLQPQYEAAQLRVFAAMFKRGSIYRGLKPVWYSPSSRTALAEAELEYPDGTVAGVPSCRGRGDGVFMIIRESTRLVRRVDGVTARRPHVALRLRGPRRHIQVRGPAEAHRRCRPARGLDDDALDPAGEFSCCCQW